MADKRKTKKQLINAVDDCVDEMMEGAAAMNPNIKIIKGHPRVAIRADIEEYKASDKVTVVSGGGSGHEPLSAGYIGQGMLSAGVAGSVFASPPPRDILAAIQACATPAGTLLVVANYTGDRLVFGIAAERARAEGLRVATVTVAEDCALTSTDKTAGRRGLCGYIVMYKMAGALAEEGRSLDEILEITTRAAKCMGTMGVSLSACHVPGEGASFQIADDELEVGLGVHGEAGVRRMKMAPADDVMKMMIDHMTNPSTSSHIDVKEGDRVAIMLNNLGGTSILEFLIMIRAAVNYLESKGIVLERLMAGHFMTSLDMAGLQLCIMHLDDDRRRALDAETNAVGWQRYNIPLNVDATYKRLDGKHLTDAICTMGKSQPQAEIVERKSSNSYISKILVTILRSICEKLISAKEELNTLDTSAGDGDCGSTLAAGAQRILSCVDEFTSQQPHEILDSLAVIVENTMGGASGGLYSLLLTGASGEVRRNPDTASVWVKGLESGISAVSKYGGAQRGDRTMLDPLFSALDILQDEIKHGREITKDIFDRAVQAAENTATMTKDMEAHAGRASYVNRALITLPDPGAQAVAIWLRAIHRSL
ncbi:triokinase/FMN cyclase-like [Amphiura filiformis]|uniref:triokinase/FMN cyclase-like n=1 Tax=Amphiura filiformis TaxID=82378 RepID=UPI003B21A7F0